MNEEYLELFDSIKEYERYLASRDQDAALDNDPALNGNLEEAIKIVSFQVYGMLPEKAVAVINMLNSNNPEKYGTVDKMLSLWLDETEHDIKRLSANSLGLDRNFEKLMLMVERCSEESLIKHLMSELTDFAEKSPSNLRRLISVYTELEHLWGGFDPETGNYSHFINGIHAVKEHTDDIRWLYGTVEDYRSRKVIYGLVKFWLELDFEYKNSLRENNYDDYFDLDVFAGKITDKEIFVDCGAYTGDTAETYFRNFTKCCRMYLYDMIPANLDSARERLVGHEEIVYRNAGVGSPEQSGTEIKLKNAKSTTLSLTGGADCVNPELNNVEAEDVSVRMVTIDEDIEESISFLKMDIEGAEIDALMGAKRHITDDHPKLAICTYHHYEHLWEIPKLIRSMASDYKIYIRYNDAFNSVTASEHVMLAI